MDYLNSVMKKLNGNMRKIVEETNPYNVLREELVREFFDPLHNAKRFERS